MSDTPPPSEPTQEPIRPDPEAVPAPTLPPLTPWPAPQPWTASDTRSTPEPAATAPEQAVPVPQPPQPAPMPARDQWYPTPTPATPGQPYPPRMQPPSGRTEPPAAGPGPYTPPGLSAAPGVAAQPIGSQLVRVMVAIGAVLVFIGWVRASASWSTATENSTAPAPATTVRAPRPDHRIVTSPALAPEDGPGEVALVYEVTSTGAVDIEYKDANGDLVRLEQVPTPWRMELRTHPQNQIMVLGETDSDTIPVTCQITLDGRVVERQTDTDYGASCFA